MADFMISYTSAERHRAERIASDLRSRGNSVWMDTATDERVGLMLPGIPGGQQHWTTIRAAIDEASTFLILETEAWHRSEYCARELQYAQSIGKRIAALGEPIGEPQILTIARSPENDPSNLLLQLSEGNQAAATHARLVTELSSGQAQKALFGRQQVKDAELLSTAPLPQLGLSMNAELLKRVAALLRTGQHRRRWLGGAAGALCAILLALSILAGLAYQKAQVSSAAANDRANFAASLQLAQQAIQAKTTVEAIQLAQRSVSLNDNEATRAALKATESSAYRSTSVIPSGTSSSAAVSNDGRSALIMQGASLHISDVAAGQVTTLPLSSSSRRLAISPDGQTGYWIDGTGGLGCINVKERQVIPSVQADVAAISMSPEGKLWWLDTAGRLFNATSCPTNPSTPVATGLTSVRAFLVAGSPANVFTLTTTGAVNTRPLPETNRPIGPPAKEIVLSTIPLQGTSTATDTPDLTTTNLFTQCGDVIHVVAGFKSPLHASAHVAFSLSGEPISQRTVATELVGVGCAPGGQAWGTPTLYGRPFALPSSGSFPANEIDERDQQTRVVLANSPDSSHSIVVHSDGRVDVLTVAKAQWVAAAERATVAVPIQGGVVTVASAGEVQITTDTGSRALGNLGTSPSPWTAALTDTAFVAAGDRVFAITAGGITASEPLPGTVGVIDLSDQGTSLTVSGHNYRVQIHSNLSGPTQPLTPPNLPNGEAISSTVTDQSRQIVATSYGNVLVTDEAGKVLAQTSTGVAGITHARVLPDHSIVVAGGDGRLNKYSPDLKLLSSHMFGPMAAGLEVSQDGRTLLVALTGNFSVWAVEATTLQPIAKVATKTPDIRLVKISSDGRTVVQLIPPAASSADPARIVRTSL